MAASSDQVGVSDERPTSAARPIEAGFGVAQQPTAGYNTEMPLIREHLL